MPERFEIYIVYKRRYINTLLFLSNKKLIYHVSLSCEALHSTITFDHEGALTSDTLFRLLHTPSDTVLFYLWTTFAIATHFTSSCRQIRNTVQTAGIDCCFYPQSTEGPT